MIIQCEKCNTRFKLDDSRITETGVRVRCSRCSHTFVVRKDVPHEESDFDVLLQGFGAPDEAVVKGEDDVCAGQNPPEPPRETEFFVPSKGEGTEPSAVDSPPCRIEDVHSAESLESSEDAGSGFVAEGFGLTHFQVQHPSDADDNPDDAGLDMRLDEACRVADAGADREPASDDGAPEDASAEEGEAPAEEERDISALEREMPAQEREMTVEEEQVSAREENGALPSVDTAEGEQLTVAAADENKWPVAGTRADEMADDELPPLSITSRKKKSPVVPVSIGLACLLLAAGAAFLLLQNRSCDVGGRITGIGTKGETRASIRALEGSFLINREAGELFVLRGEMVNSSDKPLSGARVQGTVYGADGSVLVRRTVYCGNSISPEELSFRSFSGMEKTMNRQFGDTLSNLEIAPGSAVPFVIVFKNVPGEGKDYGVDIVDIYPVPPADR